MDKIWPVIKFCLYTLAYFLGKKDAVKDMELKANKRALDAVNNELKKQARINAAYDKLKEALPSSWAAYDKLKEALPSSWADYDSKGRVRKTNKN